jgi:RNA recognition motif-containing protein
MRLYVGNLHFQVTDEELRSAFSAYGRVTSATVVIDRDTGRSRGFGFVEMPNRAEAEAAIRGLHGSRLRDRVLTVNEARERAERPAGRRW